MMSQQEPSSKEINHSEMRLKNNSSRPRLTLRLPLIAALSLSLMCSGCYGPFPYIKKGNHRPASSTPIIEVAADLTEIDLANFGPLDDPRYRELCNMSYPSDKAQKWFFYVLTAGIVFIAFHWSDYEMAMRKQPRLHPSGSQYVDAVATQLAKTCPTKGLSDVPSKKNNLLRRVRNRDADYLVIMHLYHLKNDALALDYAGGSRNVGGGSTSWSSWKEVRVDTYIGQVLAYGSNDKGVPITILDYREKWRPKILMRSGDKVALETSEVVQNRMLTDIVGKVISAINHPGEVRSERT